MGREERRRERRRRRRGRRRRGRSRKRREARRKEERGSSRSRRRKHRRDRRSNNTTVSGNSDRSNVGILNFKLDAYDIERTERARTSCRCRSDKLNFLTKQRKNVIFVLS